MTSDPTGPAEPGALAELAGDSGSRKKFLRMAGGGVAGGLAVLIAACGDGSPPSSSSSATPAMGSGAVADTGGGMKSDLKILNYALTLEYLETDFYNQVLDSGLITDKNLQTLAKNIAQVEQDHVDALTKTIKSLGGK